MTNFSEIKLEHGSVRIYTIGGYKLHAYATADIMSDESFLLEAQSKLIAIEGPAFQQNIKEWQRYITGLAKPLEAVILAYHPNGGRWYGNAKSYATQAATDSKTSGGIKALVTNLNQAFGSDFTTEMAATDVVVGTGLNSIAGVDFIFTSDAEAFTIEIPAINAIYLHMLGANVHSIMVNTTQMDAFIQELEGFKAKNFDLILSSHHQPEPASALDIKIAYVKKAKEIAMSTKNKEDFISRMTEAFPAYAGQNYLEMSANAIYQ